MKLTTELLTRKQKAIIVSKTSHHFVTLLKEKLKQYDMHVHVSPELPHDISAYSACFFIQEANMYVSEFLENTDKKFVFIFFQQDELAKTYSAFAQEHHAYHIKVINLETSAYFFKDDIEAILWFTFSRSDEIFLHIYHPTFTHHLQKHTPKAKKIPFSARVKSYFTPKRLVLTGLLIIFITHILFIPPLIIATYFNIQAGKALINKDIEKGKALSETSQGFYTVGRSLFNFARPVLLLFSLALYPEDLFEMNQSTYNIITTSISLQEHAKVLNRNLLNKSKTEEQTRAFYQDKEQIINEFRQLHQDLLTLQAKMPTWTPQLQEAKNDLTKGLEVFDSVDKLIPHLDTLFARGTTKQYLLLFANNMELRPGGGFIGSFGILKIKDYTIEELKVYDVYDADGQLKEVVEPPEPIKKYLNQPYWFLRDSAFSPDFVRNYNQATLFLDKELKINNFDGGILLTTTTIQNILEAVGELYVPDFEETVTKDNFYIKAQTYAEKDFFPGSLQKKQFLGSVMDQLLVDLEKAPAPKLMQMLKKSLDEKQMVIYMNDASVQTSFDELYWSGRTITPQCTTQNNANCIVDTIFPYDANLGVNKANFFISRPVNMKVSIGADGKISNTLTLNYTNDSTPDLFPGGTYKNYFQISLPQHAIIKQITNNNQKIEKYDEKLTQFRDIGFLVETPPKSSSTIVINYELAVKLDKGNGTYQLVVQKQIGSQNSDMELKIAIPNNMSIVNKNFSPLVKDNEIIYNTTITSDKIFILDLYRE